MDLKRDRHLRSEERRSLPSNRQPKIDFASNDYLGFARSSRLRALFHARIKGLKRLGSTGSRLLTGNSTYCERLEEEIAAYHGEEAGLIFSSGYTANLGLLSAIAGRDDYVVYDESVHASIRDGIALSRARNYSFRHNDVDDLKKKMKRCSRPPFVIVESLYSTDGSRAPLLEIAPLTDRLIVDEAHATGVYGPGLVTMPVLARIHTFSKALGAHGAIVLGSRRLRDFLITSSRPFIYSTALSMPQIALIESAYALLREQNPFPFPSPILTVPISPIPEEFDIRPLRYPTVARGKECLRVCLHTFNTSEEIERLYAWIDRHRN
ncbi:MAG: pyridoxal phosphate-dependent aminotransferase family protein [Chlamydiales bacterium]|nr:pyridoxal phosphate-dependent aminotransferase family protein [Chlamydiales bacterium]